MSSLQVGCERTHFFSSPPDSNLQVHAAVPPITVGVSASFSTKQDPKLGLSLSMGVDEPPSSEKSNFVTVKNNAVSDSEAARAGSTARVYF